MLGKLCFLLTFPCGQRENARASRFRSSQSLPSRAVPARERSRVIFRREANQEAATTTPPPFSFLRLYLYGLSDVEGWPRLSPVRCFSVVSSSSSSSFFCSCVDLLKRRCHPFSLRNTRGSRFLVRSSKSRDDSFGCEGPTAESNSDFFEAMSSESKKSSSNGNEKLLTLEEEQAKINEVRRLIGTTALPEKLSIYCSDASLARHLRARNWNVKKATKMLKDTLKWRSEYKPEEIRWEDIAHEAETGKIYRSNYIDKHGRTVLVMRPSRQTTKGQIKYLVYCMENAILNLPSDQEQMVWLIDFQGFKLSHISVKVTKETAYVLQDQYPERLGVAILYNPPKFFEPFFSVVKPFLEPKTYNKVKFVYSDDLNSKKIMEDLFDMDQLESAFGGNDATGFDIDSDPSDNEKAEDMMGGVESEIASPIDSAVPTNIGDNRAASVHS
ncbi:hypothetical protein NL676_026172 [Syzygium grande]|nr:hypothetical protein NL676_026172 [Syzygium grande]